MAENILEQKSPTLKHTHMNWIKSTLNTIMDPACGEMPSGSFSRAKK